MDLEHCLLVLRPCACNDQLLRLRTSDQFIPGIPCNLARVMTKIFLEETRAQGPDTVALRAALAIHKGDISYCTEQVNALQRQHVKPIGHCLTCFAAGDPVNSARGSSISVMIDASQLVVLQMQRT